LEARAQDFERVGKRRYTDRATGIEYEHCVWLPVARRRLRRAGGGDIDCFFVDAGRLVSDVELNEHITELLRSASEGASYRGNVAYTAALSSAGQAGAEDGAVQTWTSGTRSPEPSTA
jgi:hypothetical protein